MSPPRHVPVCIASSAVLLASAAVAQEEPPRPDTSEWLCEECPFPKGHRADVDLGGSYVSEDSARFGNYTGLDEKGGYVDANGSGEYAGEAYRFRWDAEDLGLDSRVVTLEGGVPGTYDYRIGYSQLPYRRYDTSQTIFERTAEELLTLPAGWVPAGTTDGFTALGASLVDRNIESDRQTIDVGGGYRGTRGLRLNADFKHTERDGWGIAGAPFYMQSVLLAAPLDEYTDTANLGATYGRESWSVSLSWLGSFYKNSIGNLRWENPYIGGGDGARAGAPDNDSQVIALDGAYHLPAQTVLSLSAAIGTMKQEDTLLPYTVNPAVPAPGLPRDSLDGKIDTTHVDLGFTSRPWSFLRLKGVYRYDDRDNRTPVEAWTRTITDLFDSGESEANRPYSFTRKKLGLSATARFTKYEWLEAFEFEGGYDRIEMERTLQEVSEDASDSGWGRLRWRPTAASEISIRAGGERRDPDSYDLDVAAGLEQNPLMRKYTQAYRFRDFFEFNARLGWPDKPFSIGAEAYYSSTDYTESPLGLRKLDDRRFTADFTWTVSDNASLYLQGGYEDQAIDIRSSESFATRDWLSAHQDTFESIDAGFRFRTTDEKFDANVSLRYARGNGDIDVTSSFSGSGAYPNLESKLAGGELKLGYHINDALELRFGLRYEDYSSSDWALQGVEPSTIPTVLTFGADPDDYNVTLATLSFRYSFGRPKAAAEEEEESAE